MLALSSTPWTAMLSECSCGPCEVMYALEKRMKFQGLWQTGKGVCILGQTQWCFCSIHQFYLCACIYVQKGFCRITTPWCLKNSLQLESAVKALYTDTHWISCWLIYLKHSTDKENCIAPSSKISYCNLSTPEEDLCLSCLHSSLRTPNCWNARWQACLEDAAATYGETLDAETHSDLKIMNEHFQIVANNYAPDSFASIFWQQEIKAATVKTASLLQWHLLMIKWCLHMQHILSGGYEALQKSGCLSLPFQPTMCDYTHYALVKSWFSMAVDYQFWGCSGWSMWGVEKVAALLMDEMYHVK